MLQELPAPPAIVRKMETRGVYQHHDPLIADLQLRAERHVAALDDEDVIAYEIERANLRAGSALPPVPVTDRGLRVLTARQFTVDEEGYLTLG